MEHFFKLKEHGTDVRTEIIAGVTTFMTMAYILAVNPAMLGPDGAGMDSGAVFTATALASAAASFLMAFLANLPFVLSAGMGLNAYFAYTVCGSMGYSWEVALTAVFVEGIIFILLSGNWISVCKCGLENKSRSNILPIQGYNLFCK